MKQCQFRIVQRILATPSRQFKMGFATSPYCKICGEKDDIIHTLLRCRPVKKFWKKLANSIYEIENIGVVCSDETVLFGYHNNVDQFDLINTLIIVGKYYVYIQRLHEKDINIRNFKFYMKRYLLRLQYMSDYAGHREQFDHMWRYWL